MKQRVLTCGLRVGQSIDRFVRGRLRDQNRRLVMLWRDADLRRPPERS